MKRPGETVVLRCAVDTTPLEIGDVLVSTRGRRYLIQEINEKRLTCLILKPTEILSEDTKLWGWKWGK